MQSAYVNMERRPGNMNEVVEWVGGWVTREVRLETSVALGAQMKWKVLTGEKEVEVRTKVCGLGKESRMGVRCAAAAVGVAERQ